MWAWVSILSTRGVYSFVRAGCAGLAAFAAPPYVYSMRMETGAVRLAEHRATFAAVARTVAPVPAPGERHAIALAAPPADLFAYLLD